MSSELNQQAFRALFGDHGGPRFSSLQNRLRSLEDQVRFGFRLVMAGQTIIFQNR